MVAGSSSVSAHEASRALVASLLKLQADRLHNLDDIVEAWRPKLPRGCILARHFVPGLGPCQAQHYGCGTQGELSLLTVPVSERFRLGSRDVLTLQ